MNIFKIDALAVMDRAAPIIGNSADGDAYAVITIWPAARDAVAELIEAATLAKSGLALAASKETPDFLALTLAGDRLSAALARVGGAA